MTTEIENAENAITLKKAFVPMSEYLNGLPEGTIPADVMTELVGFMRSNKGAGGGGGRKIIREVMNSAGELFALRCRATGILVRLTDTNGEPTYASVERSKNGFAHNCLAVNEHKALIKDQHEKASTALREKAIKKDWTVSKHAEEQQALDDRYAEMEVEIPDTYVTFETVEEAQEAAN